MQTKVITGEADVSVIVPVYRGKEWVRTCLSSLARQTLAPEHFEVVLALNGPPDGAREVIESFAEEHPTLRLKIIELEGASSASLARNAALEYAVGRHVTWLDCDDWLSPSYLESLLACAMEGLIPLAQIVNVDSEGRRISDNPINRDILSHGNAVVGAESLHRALGFVACKLVPRAVVVEHPFDSRLRSGEDVAMFAAIYGGHSFRFDITPALAGAKYFRLLTSNSVSRRERDFDFCVTQRLDVIESMNDILSRATVRRHNVIKRLIHAQASFIRDYIRDNPSKFQLVADAVTYRKLKYFPWHTVRPKPSGLVVAYNFSPFADTGAVVVAKRIRGNSEVVDVVSNDMSAVRDVDASIEEILRPYVRKRASLGTPVRFSDWHAISEFVQKGLKEVWGLQGDAVAYERIYSRAMWPASHFLAAMCRTHGVGQAWTAEFSDPLAVDTTGQLRRGPVEVDAMAKLFLDEVPERTRNFLIENPNIFIWAETLPYQLADEIVFTNRNQAEIMLSAIRLPDLAERVRGRMRIEPQPTLPPGFYRLGSPVSAPNDGCFHIAYFGDFYATRNLDDVVKARGLLPVSVSEKVRLHVFTRDVVKANRTIEREDASWISVLKSLGYLDFLAATEEFDCLLVNDAVTAGHHIKNPYLPSKWADYRGARARTWAIVEPGSVLSNSDADCISLQGDIGGAARILENLVNNLDVDARPIWLNTEGREAKKSDHLGLIGY